MTVHSAVYSVSTASVTLCAPSVEPQHVHLVNMQPTADPGAYSSDGYVWLAHSLFNITNNGTVSFQITTGDHGAQFEFYQIVADSSSVHATLYEGAAFGSATPVTAYNLNRTAAGTYSSVLTGATAVSGGTAISAEFVPASNQGGAVVSVDKVHTLAPNTSYVMSFVDSGGNGTDCFFQLGFSEQFNGGHSVWINNSAGSAFELRGGETAKVLLYPLEILSGIATQDVQVGVLRQEQS